MQTNKLNKESGKKISFHLKYQTTYGQTLFVYGNHPLFAVFLSACGKVSKKLKQTLLACLAPPKVSIKARFMNLHRLVIWADNILKQDIPGAAEQGSLLEKLRASLCELPQCKEFITAFIRDVMPLMACQKIIKSKGH